MSISDSELAVQEAELFHRLEQVQVPEAAGDGIAAAGFTTQWVTAEIIKKVLEYLQEANVIPSKADVLAMVEKWIDQVLTGVRRPALVAILKPLVKQAVLTAVGQLYDSIFTRAVEV